MPYSKQDQARSPRKRKGKDSTFYLWNQSASIRIPSLFAVQETNNILADFQFFALIWPWIPTPPEQKTHLASRSKCLWKCLCVAFEYLRAYLEEFFKIKDVSEDKTEVEEDLVIQNYGIDEGYEGKVENGDDQGEMEPLKEARNSGPVSWSGRVAHLVKAFERLLSMPSTEYSYLKAENESKENNKEGMKLALPGLQQPKVSSSWDNNNGNFSISRRTSGGERRSPRNSIESCCTVGGRVLKKQLKATCQRPFNLRTEQRGHLKKEQLMKKIQKLVGEEEKLRIPIAQGLPWTTDEPKCLIKPPVKKNTIPIDLKLHSDIRAVEHARFADQVAEKRSLIKQYKMERERRQKLEEKEEIKRLRKELIPKAQPMPYFDRPFVPRRSEKQPTVPQEPKFCIPQHKTIKCCRMSCNDMSGPSRLQHLLSSGEEAEALYKNRVLQ